MFYPLTRRLLFSLPPELAHHAALNGLKAAAALRLLDSPENNGEPYRSAERVMGLRFRNRVGLAAGLDKNGDYLDALAALGFGFIEIGTVTPRPQPGNPRPRLFRIREAEALINRLGFNNKGLDHMVARLRRPAGHYRRRLGTIVGVNIGKNKDTPLSNAIADYRLGLHAVYPYADYVTVNISSPNTVGLRELQHGDVLRPLLQTLKAEQTGLAERHGRYVPLAVKIAPDLGSPEITSIAAALLESGIDAVIATNTTLARDAVAGLPHSDETGGLSGAPLARQATAVVQELHARLAGRLPIIAAGGIMSADEAAARITAGASLVQLYTGLIYRGPRLVSEIARTLATLPSEL